MPDLHNKTPIFWIIFSFTWHHRISSCWIFGRARTLVHGEAAYSPTSFVKQRTGTVNLSVHLSSAHFSKFRTSVWQCIGARWPGVSHWSMESTEQATRSNARQSVAMNLTANSMDYYCNLIIASVKIALFVVSPFFHLLAASQLVITTAMLAQVDPWEKAWNRMFCMQGQHSRHMIPKAAPPQFRKRSPWWCNPRGSVNKTIILLARFYRHKPGSKGFKRYVFFCLWHFVAMLISFFIIFFRSLQGSNQQHMHVPLYFLARRFSRENAFMIEEYWRLERKEAFLQE